MRDASYLKFQRQASDLRTRAADLRSRAKLDSTTPSEALVLETTAAQAELTAERSDAFADRLERRSMAEAHHICEHGVTVGGSSTEEADEFRHYMKTGETRAALVSGTGANGGYVVPEALHGPLIEKYRKIDPISALATHIDMAGNSTMYLPYKSAHGAVATATETGARSEQVEPQFTGGATTSLTAYDYYTDQRASQTWVDSTNGGEDLILNWVFADLAEQFGVDVAVGDGNTKASGLFAATSYYSTTLSGSAGAISNTAFQALFSALNPVYWPDAAWLMNAATLGVAMGFSLPNLNNTPLVQTNPDGSFSIMGKPVYVTSSAPAIGAANYPIAFGDISQAFIVGTHHATSVLRDPYTAAPLVRYYGLARIGGRPWNPNACVLMKSNNS